MVEHFAGVRAAAGVGQPGLDALLELATAGQLWIKLSAPSRASNAPQHADLAPIARAMVAANPDRLLWASDWPHTGGGMDRARRGPAEVEPFRPVDDRADLRRLAEWIGDPAVFGKVLRDNPAALYRR